MKKSSIPKLAATAAIAFLSGCIQDPTTPEATKPGPTAPVQMGGPMKSSYIKGDSLFESGIAEGYQYNPNWKRLAPEKPALAKEAGMLYETTDWTGVVVTRTYECTASGYHVSVVCGVEPDFVVVGGGAYADYGTGPGALLTESRPLDDLTGWAASSKDQVSSNYHTLHCYAIGLRIVGLDRPTLMANMKVSHATSSKVSNPGVGAGFPNEDYVVVGGGARADWQSYGTGGSLLTQSYPYFGNIGWYAMSKDHKISNPAILTSYAIGMTSTWFFGTGSWLERKVTYADGMNVATGAATATATVTPGWVLTGPGGTANYTYGTVGRLLYGIWPNANNSSVTVFSKDHISTCAGSSSAYAVQIEGKH